MESATSQEHDSKYKESADWLIQQLRFLRRADYGRDEEKEWLKKYWPHTAIFIDWEQLQRACRRRNQMRNREREALELDRVERATSDTIIEEFTKKHFPGATWAETTYLRSAILKESEFSDSSEADISVQGL